ncbi:hypothetical protein SDC9_64437 [bioreactor metagenome]|uniref:Nitroreductase domain-containing protein n=1 Tax=bioreactor metagenome TaxID=1076179 RepID=A0A644XPB5_9ZZZZ
MAQAPAVIAVCIDNNVISTAEARTRELREANAFVDTPLNDISNDSEAYAKRRKAMEGAALKAYLGLNAAIAIDHITLRAVDLGLGSCWVMMFDKEKTKELLKLDERYDVIALLPIGYPDQSPLQRPRISMDEILLKEI